MAPSRLLFALLCVLSLLVPLLLWGCRLPLWLFLLAVSLALACLALEWRRLRGIRGLLATRERRWFWNPAGGEVREFRLCGELLLWPWLIVINGRDRKGRQLRLLLARDAMDEGDWRRLKVALRFSR